LSVIESTLSGISTSSRYNLQVLSAVLPYISSRPSASIE
jgi:hypothetical protein